MFVLAGAVIACGLAMLTPYQVTAAPGVDPNSIERRVPPDNVAMYTPDYFLRISHAQPPPDTCLFYTAGLTGAAVDYAKNNLEPYFTIWDIWDPAFYNRSQATTNPLREILKFQINNNPDTQSYFRHMSQAYAELCSGDVLVMTDNPKNVNEKGIWGQVEKPTLQQTGNVGGQVNVIDSMDGNGSNIPWPPYWVRPGTHLASVISSELPSAPTPSPIDKLQQLSPIAALPYTPWTGAQLAEMFSDVDQLW